MAWAETHGLNGRAAAEAERFRDYWHACPGQRGRKADWAATWRNWVRKAAETGAVQRKGRATGLDAVDELFGPDGRTYDGEVVR